MKRLILVLAVALILCASAWDNGHSRVTPWDYQDPSLDQGEDHPWGGEHSFVPPTPLYSAGSVDRSASATGFFLIDFWFGHLFDVLEYYQEPSAENQRETEPLNHEITGSTITTRGN